MAEAPDGVSAKVLFSLLVQKLVQLGHKGVDVLELAIDRGKTDIGHLVGGFQLFHDLFADHLGAGLTLQRVLQKDRNRLSKTEGL